MQVMPSPIRTITLVFTFVGVGFYWLVFLSQPLLEGASTLNRAFFILSAVVYPDGFFVGSWTDQGRLPLGLLDRWPIMLGTLAWLALATAIGWPICRPSVPAFTTSLRMAASLFVLSLACLCGLALLSTLTLVVGLAGGLQSAWPMLAGICCLLIGSYAVGPITASLKRQRSLSIDPPPQGDAPSAPVEELNPSASTMQRATLFQTVVNNTVVAATIWLGAVTMLGAWVPPSEFDVVEYHLQAPKEFYQAGRIEFVPHNIYANMPLGAEMHTLAVMSLWSGSDTWFGGLTGKSITASISLVGALLLGSWVAMRLGSLTGWSAAGIWLGTPGITHVAALGLIDGVLAVYVLATALAACHFVFAPSQANSTATAFPIGLLAGAAAGIKYPGLIFATLPCLLLFGYWLVRSYRQQSTGAAIRGSLIMLIGLSLTALPWYAKNWWLAGNPVYPLAAGLFGGQTLTPEKIAQWQAAHRVPAVDLANFVRDLGQLTVTSYFVQPAMIFGVACACVWLLRRGKRRTSADILPTSVPALAPTMTILLTWSIWILVIWWLATHRIDRFWLPMTGLWAALAAWGLWQVRQVSTALAQTMLISGLLYAVLICSSSVVADNRYFVSLAGLRDDVGDAAQVPRVPRVQTWINQNLAGADARVLLIGEARVFEYRVEVVYSTCFDTNPGEAWLTKADPAAQRSALTAAGITHVLVNWVEIARYRSPGNYGFSEWPQPSHIEQLVRDQVLEPIAWGDDSNQVQLFRVNSTASSK